MQMNQGIQPGSVQEYAHSHPWVWIFVCCLPVYPIPGSQECCILNWFQYASPWPPHPIFPIFQAQVPAVLQLVTYLLSLADAVHIKC